MISSSIKLTIQMQHNSPSCIPESVLMVCIHAQQSAFLLILIRLAVWATIWITFQLLCLGGFSILGIYAFKASLHVSTVGGLP